MSFFLQNRRLLSASLGVTSMALGSQLLMNETAKCEKTETKKQKIVIVGGGAAGISVSAFLGSDPTLDVVVVDPSRDHYYQPMWTLVGGGLKNNTQSKRPMKDMIHKNVTLIDKKVESINPNKNQISLSGGKVESYDYLVVAPGIELDWKAIPGVDSVGKGKGIISIYDYDHCQNAAAELENFKGGRVLFTIPNSPVKCAGAPQKIMWLFEEKLCAKNLRGTSSPELWSAGPGIFGVKKYADMLWEEAKTRNVKINLKQELVKVQPEKKIAVFKNLETGTLSEQKYDLLHVVPPMKAPKIIKDAGLADAGGWMDVDKYSLQSTKFKNVFGLGDCTNTPNGKTAAAVFSQAPVVVHNLQCAIKKQPLNGYYNGYGSCPLVVGSTRVILAEFGYGGKIMETFAPFQIGPVQERIFAFMKREVFPFVYWHAMPRGIWYGHHALMKPDVTKKPTDDQGKPVC